jgi:hypothetical protein
MKTEIAAIVSGTGGKTLNLKVLLVLFSAILVGGSKWPVLAAPSPQAPAKSGSRKGSQVDQVIQLTKSGMSEGLIIKFLQKNGTPANLTGDDLVKLKQAGVSENVIAVMIDPTASPAAPAAPPVAATPVTATAPAAPAPAAPVALPPARAAQRGASTGDWRSAIQQRIESDYPLTQASGDKADIISAGAVLVLKKNSLVFHIDGVLSNANTYKGGKLSAGFFGGICKGAQDGNCRTFVKGEKFWLTAVDVKEDGLLLQFLSDPLPDNRFSGTLKFPIGKGSQPTPDEMAALVAEVIGVDGGAPPVTAQSASVPSPAAPSAASAPPQPQPLPAIAPPPPPADQPPPTVSLGQTKDQVVAMLGQPTRVATVGTKQILYFTGLKVTLVHGKVTDVQ